MAQLSDRIAVAAAGGYGRCELFPHSDVDVLILTPQDPDTELREAIERWVRMAWDAGLEIGHSVRTPEDCVEEAQRDVTVQTNLLETRWLWGSHALFERMRDAFATHFDRHAFFEAKLHEQRRRHARFMDSAYNLEPNLKESPGGLRDLHVVAWLARTAGIGASWRALAHAGLMTLAEARQVEGVQRFLSRLRIHLHLLTGRREERLIFDLQSALADRMGYRASAHRMASEALMSRYFRAAKTVLTISEVMVQNLKAHIQPMDAPPVPIDSTFQRRGDWLALCDETQPERDPGTILEAFVHLTQDSTLKGLSAPTVRTLWRARRLIDARFRGDARNRANFMALLRAPHGVTTVLRLMNRYGLLGSYIPAFGRIVGRMQHDLFHVYTVDEHILMVLRNLRRLTVPELAHEYPLASQLMAGFERQETLLLAALFHDIAKGRGGDHSTLGARDARRFCRAHGLSETDTELVAWLVDNHLIMSATAQKQDLSDPEVVASFATRMRNERHLTALYLLTLADIRGTSPKVWNAWKGKLLESLFHATRRVLAGGAPFAETGVEARKREADRLLQLYGLKPGTADPLWRRLPESYFLREDARDLAWQARMLLGFVPGTGVRVRARLSPVGEGVEVLVCAADTPELFARTCAFFERIRYTIMEARLHTSDDGFVLDTFLAMDEAARAVPYRDFLAFIEHDLPSMLDRDVPLPPPTTGRASRRVRHFPVEPRVTLRPDEKGELHMLEVVCADRPGLLSSLARVFLGHGIRVDSAKITTLGERAMDVFMIRPPDNGRILDYERIEREIRLALSAPA